LLFRCKGNSFVLTVLSSAAARRGGTSLFALLVPRNPRESPSYSTEANFERKLTG
jgi:hypothetical protein